MTTIEELRLRLDISQRALAELAGVSEATVSNAELGRPVLRSKVAKIAAALDVPASELTGVKYHSAVQAAQKRKRSQQNRKPR